MGKPMARNLLKGGYELVAYNRSQEVVEELVREGARAAGSPKELAQACTIIITMLPDSPDVEGVLIGEDGVFEGMEDDALLIDMSTISPVAAIELAQSVHERGASMLDAPVSGGEQGAINGTLSIMAGGREEDFERAKPLFKILGKTINRVGENGAGQVVKAANQIVAALILEAVSEALVLGAKAGVDPAKMIEVLSGGMAQNRMMEAKSENFLKHDFTPGFRLELHRKDLRIALATGREYGVSLPVTAFVEQVLEALVVKGLGSEDHSAIITHIEDLAQYKVGERP
jgi:2-hydroxy-3-oxopropionate reductase